MITALAFAAILGSPVQDKIDFQLGWKKGDKLTYSVGMGDRKKTVIISGVVVLSVLSENEKGFTVGSSRIEYEGESNLPLPPTPAGTIQISHKGRVTEGPGKSGRGGSAGMYFVYAVLPSKPVSVGDKFLVSVNHHGMQSELEGTFVSLDGAERTLAKFEFTGQLTDAGGTKFPLTVKSTFDTKRKIFVSLSANLNEGMVIRSFKLKEPPK